MSSSAVGRMARKGLLIPEHTGVYAVGHASPAPLARETAALLACGDRALLSHISAAAAWRIMDFAEGPIDVTVASLGTGRRRPGIELHRSGSILARDVRIHEALPMTSPARTLLDISALVEARSLERALDEALAVSRIVTRSEILDVCDRAGGHAGASALRALAARRSTAITHSQAERRCLELIREAGLPEPRTQVRIAGYTVDLFWPDHRVAFEIDGFRYHTSRRAFDRDRRKDITLKGAGVDPNRLSRDQVVHEPLMTVATIAAALTRAARVRSLR